MSAPSASTPASARPSSPATPAAPRPAAGCRADPVARRRSERRHHVGGLALADDQAPGPDVRIALRLGRGVDRGDAGLVAEGREPRGARLRGEDRRDVGDRRRVELARHEVLAIDRPAEGDPELRLQGAERQEGAVGRGVDRIAGEAARQRTGPTAGRGHAGAQRPQPGRRWRRGSRRRGPRPRRFARAGRAPRRSPGRPASRRPGRPPGCPAGPGAPRPAPAAPGARRWRGSRGRGPAGPDTGPPARTPRGSSRRSGGSRPGSLPRRAPAGQAGPASTPRGRRPPSPRGAARSPGPAGAGS